MATKPTGKGRGASPERMREITRARTLKRAQADEAPSFGEAMDTVFAEWFSPAESWRAWRAAGKALFAEPLTSAELEIFQRCTGRRAPPTKPVPEAWFAVGRRGGKGWTAAALAVYLACARPHDLKRAERGVVMVMAGDRAQAGEVFRYIRELLASVPRFAALIAAPPTKESIDLTNRVRITVQTANWRRVRGRKVLAVICDEIATWWSDETNANPDHEILNALRPSMLGVNGALLLCTASPYARKGTMWDAFTTHYAADGDPVLFWKAPTWEMYPGVDREFLDLERARDPVVFAAEYGAEFRQDLDGFISRDVVDAIVVKGRVGIPPQPGVRHFAFVDTSGGGGTDSLTIAIARAGGPKVQLWRVSEWKAPYSPVDKAPEVATIAREYGVSKVVGDNFSSGVWADLVRKQGITYEVTKRTRSDIYSEFLPLANSGLVELLDHDRTIKQLLALERRTSAAGRDSIDHPKHGHDDVINAAAGALLLAHEAPKSFGASVVSVTTSTRDIARAFLEGRSPHEGGQGIMVRNRWGQLERYYDPRGE